MTNAQNLFGQCLVEKGVIAPQQLEEAIHKQQTSMGHRRIGEILVRLNYASKQHVTEGLAAQLGIPIVALRNREIPERLLSQVSGVIATTYRVVPVEAGPGRLTLAMADPTNLKLLDDLGRLLDRHVEPALSVAEDIAWALNAYYGLQDQTVEGLLRDSSVEGSMTRLTEASNLDTGEGSRPGWSQEGSISVESISIDMVKKDIMGMADVVDAESPVRRYVNQLIFEAYRQRASDIHVEPSKAGIGIRCRIDGVLQVMPAPPKRAQAAIIACLKIMAGLDITVKRLPQDGRIKMTLCGRGIDLRVSTLPAYSGESVVMRILDKRGVLMGLGELGFSAHTQKSWEHLTTLSTGVLLVTGPTGSGKTTTLYATLHALNTPARKVVTVEDPVEYQLTGINQVQVNADIGFDFSRSLRALMRQDPDVVMVGEIRDRETAETAIKAAMTGHLVFSTLHTNDAASTYTRLMDLGIAPFLVTSGVRAILAQRLVRAVCSHCRTEFVPSADAMAQLGIDVPGQPYLIRGTGCEHCNDTGYTGRVGVHELMPATDRLRETVMARSSATALKRVAREDGMVTMREDAWRKALSGLTTLEEVLRRTRVDEPLARG